MLVLCCMMASASAFVTTPLATRRSPLALRVATALPVMNIDPVDAYTRFHHHAQIRALMIATGSCTPKCRIREMSENCGTCMQCM